MGLFDSKIVNQYTDLICVLLSHIPELTREAIRAYIEKKHAAPCDEAALDKALKKFQPEEKDGITGKKFAHTWYTMSLSQQSKKGCSKFLDEQELLDICFADYKQEMRALFIEELDKLGKAPTNRSLESRMSFLETSGRLKLDNKACLIKIVGQITYEVMKERFGASDPVARALVMDAVYVPHEYTSIYAVALRARHYMEHADDAEYTSITMEDCRRAVLESPQAAGRAEDVYFIFNNADKIYKCIIFLGSASYDWRRLAGKDLRFLDGACYYAITKMAEQFEDSDLSNFKGYLDVLCAYTA